MTPIEKPTQEEQEYWNQVLRDEGFGMRRGEKIGNQPIAYGWNDDRTAAESIEDDYSEESNP